MRSTALYACSGTISAPWKVPSGNAGAMDPLKGTSIDSRRSDGRCTGARASNCCALEPCPSLALTRSLSDRGHVIGLRGHDESLSCTRCRCAGRHRHPFIPIASTNSEAEPNSSQSDNRTVRFPAEALRPVTFDAAHLRDGLPLVGLDLVEQSDSCIATRIGSSACWPLAAPPPISLMSKPLAQHSTNQGAHLGSSTTLAGGRLFVQALAGLALVSGDAVVCVFAVPQVFGSPVCVLVGDHAFTTLGLTTAEITTPWQSPSRVPQWRWKSRAPHWSIDAKPGKEAHFNNLTTALVEGRELSQCLVQCEGIDKVLFARAGVH